MKKIKCLLLMIFSLLLIPSLVSAASGTIKVTGTSTAVVGNKVTVTVTLSSATALGSWQMDLRYDKSYLQLTSSSAEAGGTMMASSSATGVKSKTYTFTFKTLKKGNTSVTVANYLAYAFSDLSEVSLTSSTKSIKIITQDELEASYSKDNNLKSLGVEGFELTTEFNSNTLDYSVIVPEDTKEINITAGANDSKASVSGTGTQTVTSGINTFQIVVRAENGAEKTYTLTVEVKDANPINVTVDNEDYTVVKIRENLPTAASYQEHTVTIDGIEVPAYKNENTNLVLVGLKTSSGEINLFIYDEETQKYETYKEIGINKITIYPLDTSEIIDGYTKGKVKIDDKEYDCFYINENSRTVIIYGVNVETGEKDFYIYDKEDQVVLKYDDEHIDVLNEKIKLYSYIIIGFSVIFVIMLLIIIFKKPRIKKKKKLKESDITKIKFDDEDKSNVIEEVSSTDNIAVYDKKDKKKKK